MSTSFAIEPRIASVTALPGHRLSVSFRDGSARLYDFTPHLSRDVFSLLKNAAFFSAVQIDTSGYALVWNDDMDIAASELWLNGQPVNTSIEQEF